MSEEQTIEAPAEDQVPLTPPAPEPEADAQPVEAESTGSDDTTDQDGETFPKTYVEKLRKEAAEARVKAKDRDEIAGRLHTALVAASGRLADPSDLPFDETHLSNPKALDTAITDLLERKPHLASRKPSGQIGQGPRTSTTGDVDLAAILRQRAG